MAWSMACGLMACTISEATALALALLAPSTFCVAVEKGSRRTSSLSCSGEERAGGAPALLSAAAARSGLALLGPANLLRGRRDGQQDHAVLVLPGWRLAFR